MVQMTPLHFIVWWLLTLGGLVNERVLRPVLEVLVHMGMHRAALGLLSPILNWYTVQVGRARAGYPVATRIRIGDSVLQRFRLVYRTWFRA